MENHSTHSRKEVVSSQQMQEQLIVSLANVLYVDSSEIDVNSSFIDLGLDSIVGVEWLNNINKQYGVEIPASVVYDYPNIQSFSTFLLDKVNASHAPMEEIMPGGTGRDAGNLPFNQVTLSSPPLAPSMYWEHKEKKIDLSQNRRNRFFQQKGIAFEPKYDDTFKRLFFYSSDCGGNFEKNGEFSVHYLIASDNICLINHQVYGEKILSTDVYVEIVYTACKTYFDIEEIQFEKIKIINPLMGIDNANCYMKVVFKKQEGGLSFAVKSSFSPDYEKETEHIQGLIFNLTRHGFTESRLTRDVFSSITQEVGNDVLKQLQKGVEVGEFYSTLRQLSFGDNFAVGHIHLNDQHANFLLNPALFFAGLTTAMFLGTSRIGEKFDIGEDVFIPVSIEKLSVKMPAVSANYLSYAEILHIEKDKAELYFEIIDAAYQPVFIAKSITIQRIRKEMVQKQVTSIRNATTDVCRMDAMATQAPVEVAVIGLSCRYPKSKDIHTFWENLKNGEDCITEVPDDRWRDFPGWYHSDPYHSGTSSNKWGGFIEDVDLFDPLFFGISPNEAEFMDPQQRIFLQECWKTIENAGYAPSSLSGQSCGVYVGCAAGDYGKVLAAKGKDIVGSSFLGTSNSILASRISYHLNLKGPAIAIDTACSSSLTALHLACESIRNRENKLAIAGGIALMISPGGHILTSQVGMQSESGRCATFDSAADGTVFSEGCGVVLLKSLPDAIKDQDNILGVIKASGINQDGKTNGITAPSSLSQAELLKQTYEKFKINPLDISYVEAHGTGTTMGDPIEVGALTNAFRSFPGDTRQYCAIGSVKTNIGHASFAAGISGFIKVLLCLEHKKLVPSLHFKNPNRQIDFAQSPFYVNTQYRDWDSDAPRLAGISSFGFSGTNVHVVVGEYVDQENPRAGNSIEPANSIVPLSAKTPGQLDQKVKDLLDYLLMRANLPGERDKSGIAGESADLVNMAYTLQIGRDSMEYRVGFLTSSFEQLKSQLQAYVRGEENISGYYKGQVKRGDSSLNSLIVDEEIKNAVVDKLVKGKNSAKLLDLWVKGLEVDWTKLYPQRRPARIGLPAYPFARESYWVEGDNIHEQAKGSVEKIHPLVHVNVSDLNQQRYQTLFHGNEFFLADHKVKGQKILPGVVYLEMARAAIVDALPADFAPSQVEIHDIVWLKPLVVETDKQVLIQLTLHDEQQIDFEIYCDNGAERSIHCQGKVSLISQSRPEVIQISSLRAKINHELDVPQFYLSYEVMGIEYGPAHKAIRKIYKGDNLLLAYLGLPPTVVPGAEQYVLHPSMMDCALQASLGLVLEDGDEVSGNPTLPFALDSLSVLKPCADTMVACVRYADDGPRKKHMIKLDVDLCDINGDVCVQIRGFSARQLGGDAIAVSASRDIPQIKGNAHSLVPVWETIAFESITGDVVEENNKILLVGSEQGHYEWARESYPNTEFLQLGAHESIVDIRRKLHGHSFEQLVWIAPDVPFSKVTSFQTHAIIEQQEEGAIVVFRLVKALLELGYGSKELRWTLITAKIHRVRPHEEMQPAHAGISGLIGSLAKEYPQWSVKLLDIDSLGSISLRTCLLLRFNKEGSDLALRDGEWFRQELVLLEASHTNNITYKQNGVYVVIGGAGGLGEVWSRYMIQTYHAQIIWIGRREINEEIKDKIAGLSKDAANVPIYMTADATSLGSLQRVSDDIRKRFPTINGVIHSAIVLKDQSVGNIDESAFRDSYSTKVNISVRIAEVFGEQDLDFMLFFSSIISFTKSPGQANYAAGCTFKDSFAHSLSQKYPYPVKIINWGFWGDVGVVSKDSYKDMMAQMGIGSIDSTEGMLALQMLMDAVFNQMIHLKTIDSRFLDNLKLREKVANYSGGAPEILPNLAIRFEKWAYDDKLTGFEKELHNPGLEDLQTELLMADLISLGFFKNKLSAISTAPPTGNIAPFYKRWLMESIRHLIETGWVSEGGEVMRDVRSKEELWQEWKNKKSTWSKNSNPQILLVETCLKGLTDILGGRKLATDVLFPDSSTKLVEEIYKHNPLADFYNEALTQSLRACIEEQLRAKPDSSFRILEIGAGTGGATERLVPLLQEYAEVISEYCYTDLSRAFLMYGEEHYADKLPFLTTALFDVSKSADSQLIPKDHFDFVIAANVLHATPNIRKTLRNAKSVLRKNGILLLNEISSWSLFTHLTFGLLEGWWLHEDTALRIGGNPGIYPDTWHRILMDEGYPVCLFPVEKAHRFGQQIIIASSDGLVRQDIIQPQWIKKQDRFPAPNREEEKTLVVESRPIIASYSTEQFTKKSISYVRRLVAGTLKIDPDQLDVARPLVEYGLDSILVNQLTAHLRKVFPGLSNTVFFEVQNVIGLTDYLMENRKEELYAQLGHPDERHLEKIVPETSGSRGGAVGAAAMDNLTGRRSLQVLSVLDGRDSKPAETTFDVAVIGIAGRYPQSDNLDEFWDNLSKGANCVTEIPKDRWEWEKYFDPQKSTPGKMYTKWGGFINDIDKFDPIFFKISPAEAENMDPQERLFIETCYHAIEDAGYTPDALDPRHKVGVFAGLMNSTYNPTPTYFSVANRVSYLFNFQGPSMTVDTACSSSLTSIHLALESLRSGLSSVAVAGGVNLIIDPVHFLRLSNMQMLSVGNRCKSFGENADGFVDAEGVGAVVLKPLRQAERDGDNIYCVIKSSAVNAGGKTNGYTVPNPKAQTDVIAEAMERAHVQADEISYVEAHGTGTALGDPIEIVSLTRAFGKSDRQGRFCAIGSLKSNIGHCESAAGVASLTKVILQLKHAQLVPSINANSINPEIDFDQTPFKLQRTLDNWDRPVKEKGGVPQEMPRVAGISSFGAGGANAHIIVAEYRAKPKTDWTSREGTDEKFAFPLSAKSAEQLKQKAMDLLAYCAKNEKMNLSSVAFTLQVGREAMEERIGFIAGSVGELVSSLEAYLDGGFAADHVYQGTAKSKNGGMVTAEEKETLKRWLTEKKYPELLEAWVNGADLCWADLYGTDRPPRVSLPAYPFARERYWIDRAARRGGEPLAVDEAEPTEVTEDLLFEEFWSERPASGIHADMEDRQTVVFTNEDSAEKWLQSEDRVFFQNAIFVYQAKHYGKKSPKAYSCRLQAEDDIERLLRDVSRGQKKSISLVYDWAKDGEEAGVHALFALFKAVRNSAVPVSDILLIGHGDFSDLKSAWDYAWIGFERSLKLVLPDVNISILYTDTSFLTARQLLEAIRQNGVVWYRDNKRFVLSVKKIDLDNTISTPVIKQNGTYLITGGCGGLGTTFAQFLAEKYHATLVLVGRSPFSPDIEKKIERLKQAGAQDAFYYAVDICNREKLQEMADNLTVELSGIIHAAGIGTVKPFYEKTSDEVHDVLCPKINGTLLLDEILSTHPLDFVCYFSSSAALLGDSGSCDYAVANRFLMGYACFRNQNFADRGRTYVLNWPLWQSGGMRIADAGKLDFYLKSSGLTPLETESGISLWEKVLSHDQVQTLVLSGKPKRIHDMLQKIYDPDVEHAGSAGNKPRSVFFGKGWKKEYAHYSTKECVLSDLKANISLLLKYPIEKLDITANLTDFGFDSIGLAALAKQLNNYFSIDITPALFFNYTTIEQFGDYLMGDYLPHLRDFYGKPEKQHESSVMQGDRPAELSLKSKITYDLLDHRRSHPYPLEPVAIIGIAGRFPKADNVDQLWSLLEKGESGISEIPLSRWDWRAYFTAPGDASNKISTNKGGFINLGGFDPDFFAISRQDADRMDPNLKLLLMESYHAMEDAGINPSAVKGSKMGVFVGMEESQYGLTSENFGYAHSGNAMISSGISYHFDLHGPNIATNTACSSGLVALHQAVRSLQQGECDAALVAGIALNLSPMSYVAMSQAGMLSQDGESHSLSNVAAGMGIGEAVAVLLLRPLRQAVANGENIYGVIRGSGTNFDGRTNGITSPNGRSQSELFEQIYADHGIDVADISHVVTHATGTKIGDSIEVGAMEKTFKARLSSSRHASGHPARCAITSIKSNVGHTLAASGLVSVIGLLKGMQHKKIPASIHCESDNDYVIWKESPFYINKRTKEWKKEDGGKPYLGGVSAFGRSGTNAHVVIEEYVPEHVDAQNGGDSNGGVVSPFIVPLSAKNEKELTLKALDLLDYVSTRRESINHPGGYTTIRNIAYTLQVGREEMDERVGFLADSVEHLEEQLREYTRDPSHVAFHRGNITQTKKGLEIIEKDDDIKKSILDKLIADRKFSKLLDLWVKGLQFDWNRLYETNRPRRTGLPNYPFIKENDPHSAQVPVIHLTGNQLKKEVVSPDTLTMPAILEEINKTIADHDLQEKMVLLLKRLVAMRTGVSLENIDTGVSFFSLGLSSLHIVDMLDKLNTFLCENIVPGIIFEHSNIGSLASFLQETYPDKAEKMFADSETAEAIDSVWLKKVDNTRAATNGIIVPIQPSGEVLPIFAVPGAGGNVFCFQPLSQILGEGQPFYGLQAMGFDGKTPPLRSVKEMAEVNIDALKAVQPSGPYTLLGYSNGGIIAFEMARMLLKKNEKIDALIFIDSLCSTLQKWDEVEQMIYLYKSLARATGVHVRDMDVEALKKADDKERITYLYDYTQKFGVEMTKEQFALFYSVSIANVEACNQYRPTKLPENIRAVLIKAKESYDAPADYGWNKWLKVPLQVYEVNANHFSIVDKEGAREIADKMFLR